MLSDTELMKLRTCSVQSVTSRYREFFIFFMVSEPESKKFGTEKNLGTGLEKILVPKKVSEPVSKNFGTEKSLGIGLEKIWYRKKVSESVSFRFWVSSHTGK